MWIDVNIISENFMKLYRQLVLDMEAPYVERIKKHQSVLAQIQKSAHLINEDSPPPLYLQASCSAFYTQHLDYLHILEKGQVDVPSDDIFNMPPLNWGKVEDYIKYEGFYFYGGKGDCGFISDQLHVL